MGIATITQRVTITLINTLQAIVEKMDVLCKCMRNFRREGESRWKNQMEILDWKNTVREMKDAHDKSPQNQGGISEDKDESTEINKTDTE